MNKIRIISSLVIASLIASCSSEKKPSLQNESPMGPDLELVKAVELNPVYEMSLPGELKPFEQVSLFAKVNGFVKEVYVDRGSKVRKGQLLAILEAPEIEQQYIAAKSEELKFEQEYLFAEQSFERLEQASKRSGAVSEIEIERSKSELNRAKAGLAASKAKTSAAAQLKQYLRIIAPFDGVINDRNISAGALVGSNSEYLFNLAQNNKLRLIVSIPEKHAGSLKKGMAVEFTVSSLPGQFFKAYLSRDGQIVQQEGRALVAEFDVNNQNFVLNGGEYAQVRLNMIRKSASVFVPQKSIIRAQSGTFIWKVDQENKLQKIMVKEGIKSDTLQEVFGVIRGDDVIVKKGIEELVEGDQVN